MSPSPLRRLAHVAEAHLTGVEQGAQLVHGDLRGSLDVEPGGAPGGHPPASPGNRPSALTGDMVPGNSGLNRAASTAVVAMPGVPSQSAQPVRGAI